MKLFKVIINIFSNNIEDICLGERLYIVYAENKDEVKQTIDLVLDTEKIYNFDIIIMEQEYGVWLIMEKTMVFKRSLE